MNQNSELLEYFSGNEMPASIWLDKYQVKNKDGNPLEDTPADMHRRLAKEFARIEFGYANKEYVVGHRDLKGDLSSLSEYGQILMNKRTQDTIQDIENEFFSYFDKFGQIVPQGSIMSNLGNKFVFGSLSNCFGIAPPKDSYAGIMRADQELVQLSKRRGGVGMTLNNLRYCSAPVTNAAKSSSGVPSFAERFSNTTREVAQEGRRGALMLLLLCKHPDIFRFVTMKDDKTKVTGANVTAMLTDEFMKAVEEDIDFICRFPVDTNLPIRFETSIKEYNKIYTCSIKHNIICFGEDCNDIAIMKIHAKELFDLIVEMAHKNAEPGIAFIDTIQSYTPDGVYEQYKPTVCNPCGEQWFSVDETCRLIALNLFGIVDNPFTNTASINMEKLYEIAYMQQRLGDNLVDLEVEYIDRILSKLYKDLEEADADTIAEAQVEIRLWLRVKKKAAEGRRTGGGFTALGDMLAAIGVQYTNSTYTKSIIERVMKTKMRAELDATIDMAILRGTFTGWDRDKEFIQTSESNILLGYNNFYKMLEQEFPEQAKRMYKYGRRNVSWSTVSPTGTVSTLTQTTSGLEPLFKAFYIRRRKVNANQTNMRVDFVDAKGDKWQEHAVLHPKFKEWILSSSRYIAKKNGWNNVEIDITEIDISYWDKAAIQRVFELSPWYGSEANDISVDTRIEIQAIIQKYTSNAISCTVNLPRDISKEAVGEIYTKAWKAGLKGITVYRDGSRDGVLITETVNHVTNNKFGYTNSVKRPEKLEGHYHPVIHNNEHYAVIVGMLDGNPYEIFTYKGSLQQIPVEGIVTKIARGQYRFDSPNFEITNLVMESETANETMLTRWASQLLRHGVDPKYVIEQIEKSNVQVVHFSKVIARVLKKYIKDEVLVGEVCPNCNSHTIIHEEGCKKCTSCGYSKC